MKMDEREARIRYLQHKHNAKRRGIEWRFTLETWLKWWGDDLDRRGKGHDRLQCQRIADSGPYSPENCRKGYPKDNSKTQSRVSATSRSRQAASALYDFLMAEKTKQASEKWKDRLAERQYEIARLTGAVRGGNPWRGDD